MPENGVKLALEAARGRGDPARSPYIKIRDVIGVLHPINETAIYNFEKKGFFPLERAKLVADAYDIPLEKLVSPTVRRALTINS